LNRFDDGEFICRFLLNSVYPVVSLSPESIYFYRQRSLSESSSYLHSSVLADLCNLVQFGFIPLARDFISYDSAKRLFLEKTVLIELSWSLRQIISNSPNHSLSMEYVDNLWTLLISLFSLYQWDGVIQDVGSGFSSIERLGIIFNFVPGCINFKFTETGRMSDGSNVKYLYFFDSNIAHYPRAYVTKNTRLSDFFIGYRYFLSRLTIDF
jgi:hypothetical protein